MREDLVALVVLGLLGLLLYASTARGLNEVSDYVESGSQTVEDLIFLAHHPLDGRGDYSALWVHGNHVYVASFDAGVHIIDVSDPGRLDVISHLPSLSPQTVNLDVKVSHLETDHFTGDLAVVTEIPLTSEGKAGMVIWDVTNPEEPELLSSVDLGAGVFNAYIHAQYVYLATVDNLAIVDISDPRSPAVLALWGGVTILWDVWASEDGTRLYLSYGSAGLVIMDATDPENPAEVGHLGYGSDFSVRSAVPTADKDIVIVTDERFECGSWGFMRIIDTSNESNPIDIGAFKIPETDDCSEEGGVWTARNPFVVGDLVYISWYSAGVLVVDISDPSNPREVARFMPPTIFPLAEWVEYQGVIEAYVQDGLLFASDVRGGVYVLQHGSIRPHVIVDGTKVGGDRVGVGSNQELGFHVSFWWPNGTTSSVLSGLVTINGISYPVDQNGWASFNISCDQVGVTSFHAETASVGEVTRFQILEGEVSIVWDRISILLEAQDERIDVGSNASITWSGHYEYDGSPFKGTVTLNDVTTKPSVGIYKYRVRSIQDPVYGLSAFRSDEVSLIFDLVDVKLSVEDPRIDVGSTAEVLVEAAYLYDETPFDGIVTLTNNLTQQDVGNITYSVAEVEGGSHGITAFQSNPLSVIFDKVEITLIPDRVEAGKRAEISWDGRYVYDGTPFTGGVIFSDDTSKSEMGRYIYTVVGISDSTYGITAFTANSVEVVFDRIVMIREVDTSTPGRVTVRIGLEFVSDGARVEDALVTVNGLRAVKVGSGTYGITFVDWSLAVPLSIGVERSGFSDLQTEETSYAYGNLAVEFGIPAVILVLAYALLRRRRARFEGF